MSRCSLGPACRGWPWGTVTPEGVGSAAGEEGIQAGGLGLAEGPVLWALQQQQLVP